MHSRLSPSDRSVVEKLIAQARPGPADVLLLLQEVDKKRIRAIGVSPVQSIRDGMQRPLRLAQNGVDWELLVPMFTGQLCALLEDEAEGCNVMRPISRNCWQLIRCHYVVSGIRCPAPKPSRMGGIVLQLHSLFECDVVHVSIPRGGGHAGNAPCFGGGISRPSARSAVVIPFPKPEGA